jgi:hypothetical protein
MNRAYSIRPYRVCGSIIRIFIPLAFLFGGRGLSYTLSHKNNQPRLIARAVVLFNA